MQIGTPIDKDLLDSIAGIKPFTKVKTAHPRSEYEEIIPALKPWIHQERIVHETIDDLTLNGYHALLMEMSTGKTKTTIDVSMILAKRGMLDAVLIIAPKALCSAVWIDEELPTHMTISYKTFLWNGKTTHKKETEFQSFLEGSQLKIFVANVEAFRLMNNTMKIWLKSFLNRHKVLMAVDESSFIKGPQAKQAKTVTLIGKYAKYRLILTGTEIQHSPLDLFQQFEFLYPGYFGVKSFFLFKTRYADLEDAYGSGGRIYKKVVGYRLLNDLVDKVNQHSSRAKKCDCFDLPKQFYITMHVDMSDKQKAMYKSLKESLYAIVDENIFTTQNKIAMFTKLRQLTGGTILFEGEHHIIDENPPKLEALVADVQGTDEQAIIWSVFVHEIEIIHKKLSSIGSAAMYYGDVKQEDRDRIKSAFQRKEIRFLIANPQVGGYGLNLQNCHLQYDYSLHTSPGVNMQKDSRIHRPGQGFDCVYKRLVCKGTVDERILSLLGQRIDIAEQFQSMKIADFIKMI